MGGSASLLTCAPSLPTQSALSADSKDFQRQKMTLSMLNVILLAKLRSLCSEIWSVHTPNLQKFEFYAHFKSPDIPNPQIQMGFGVNTPRIAKR